MRRGAESAPLNGQRAELPDADDSSCRGRRHHDGRARPRGRLQRTGAVRRQPVKDAGAFLSGVERTWRSDIRADRVTGHEDATPAPKTWDTYVFDVNNHDPNNHDPNGACEYELVSPRAELWGTEIVRDMMLFRPDSKEPPKDGDRAPER